MLINHPSDLKNVFEGSRVHSLEELHEIIRPIQMLKNSSALEFLELYRGQALEKYKLEPGLVRHTKDPLVLESIDRELMERFEHEFLPKKHENLEIAVDRSVNPSFELQWKLSFQAQHLGLKTRLLDWTINWKIGVLFTVENESHFGKDGQFWIFYCPRKWRYNNNRTIEYITIHPAEITSLHLFNYPFLLDENWRECVGQMRQARQAGRFTIQPYAEAVMPLEEQSELDQYLIKIIIDGDSKERIKNELALEGLTLDWSLYRKDSDIDSLLKEINETTIDKHVRL